MLEGFLRNIVAGRSSQSVPYVAEQLRQDMGDERLEALFDSSAAHIGRTLDVRGESEQMWGDSAVATASIRSTTRGGTIMIALLMRRTSGVWKVAGLEGLVGKVIPKKLGQR